MLRSETVQKVVVAEQVLLLLVSPGCCERTVDFAHRMVLCSLEAEQGFDFQAAFFYLLVLSRYYTPLIISKQMFIATRTGWLFVSRLQLKFWRVAILLF